LFLVGVKFGVSGGFNPTNGFTRGLQFPWKNQRG